MRWQFVRIPLIAVALILGSAAAIWAFRVNFVVNVTASVPRGIYRLVPGEIQRGDLVKACLPDLWEVREALGRHYLMKGVCPSGTSPVLKHVAALAGDAVVISETGIAVNGKLILGSKPKERDSNGEPLPVMSYAGILKSGEYVLVSENDPRGFDSRYLGVMRLPDAVRAEPFLTE